MAPGGRLLYNNYKRVVSVDRKKEPFKLVP